MRKNRFVISTGSCAGEEKEFELWMNQNYPEFNTIIENTDRGGIQDENNEMVETHKDYWGEYCSG